SAERETDGFFLRAESFFNVATQVDQLYERESPRAYGGKSLHAQSHGESFMALATHRFVGHGLYLLDEPEAALSPLRQMALLRLMYDFVRDCRSQFIVATHSPILTACPGATILELSQEGMRPIRYEDTHLVQLYRRFLEDRESFLRRLLE
ncbi:MAG: AAA family ATPase, partial [Candidatus Eremiobacterota bacterium]